MLGSPSRAEGGGVKSTRVRGIGLRIGLTVWIVYALHFSPNVVRETYLAVALGDKLSIRVDEYLGLHPDLFEIEGRGAYINNNPGASILGAIPYLMARPFLALAYRLKPDLLRPKAAASYDDPRPNRQEFFREARARGLDVKLGLAAAVMQTALMAPAAALAAVLLFLFLRARLDDEPKAIWLTLLYAFGTPIFFRSAYLNQNALISHLVLAGYVLMAGMQPLENSARAASGRLLGVGALLGTALLCDYSGAPLVLAFGVWALVAGFRHAGPYGSMRSGAWYTLGAAGPIALLMSYQWMAFGNAILPAQSYMPSTELSVAGWHGLSFPIPELLWRNLLDPHYGLFAFSPLLALALFAPLFRERSGGPTASELTFILSACAALFVFNSANNFAFLQWNTGVRYMVPAAPLLFLAAVPVLLKIRPLLAYSVVVVTVTISWSAAMVREDMRTSVLKILTAGFELPWLTVLHKSAGAYAPFLQDGVSPLPLFCLVGAVLWVVWSRRPHQFGHDHSGS